MLRRILLFILLLGGGIGLLLFVTGNPNLFQLEKKDFKEVQDPGGGSGLEVQMKDGAESSPMGQNVGVVARGPGSLVDYVAENSKNEFRLDWEDSEPRSNGTYDLVRATYVFHLRENGNDSHLKGKPKIQGKADRLNIKMQFGGGKQSIDRESEIHAFGFVMNAQGGGKDRGFSLGLSAGELLGRIRSRGLSARTPSPEERVEIRLATQGKRFRVQGRGLNLEVDQSEVGGETKTLDLRILKEIKIFDGETNGMAPFLVARGPLRIRRIDEERILMEVEHDVRLKSPAGQKGVFGVRGIEGSGERFTGLLCRGFIPGVHPEGVSYAWTEFRFHGDEKHQAKLQVSGRKLGGDHLGVSLSPSEGVKELVATGNPSISFSDDNGGLAGTLSCADSLRWSRPGAILMEAFPGIRCVLGMGLDVWPQDVVVVTGKAVFQPEGGKLVRRVESAEGLRLFFKDRFGRPGLFLGTAPGGVSARGGSGGGPVFVRIQEGMAVEPVGRGFAASLGEKGGGFVVERGSLHLEGRGKALLQALRSKEGKREGGSKGSFHFTSGFGEELKAWFTMASGKAYVEGIHEAFLKISTLGEPQIHFRGNALCFDWGGIHAEGDDLTLLPNNEVLLEGGSRFAMISRRDSRGRTQETRGRQILLRPLRQLDEWRVPVLVRGQVQTRFEDPKGGSTLSLTSHEQRFFPAPIPIFLKRRLARLSLGSPGIWLDDWLFGVGRVEAVEEVQLDLSKKDQDGDLRLVCSAETGVATLNSSFLALRATGPHGLKSVLEQRKKGRMVFEGTGARFLSLGHQVQLEGSEEIPPIFRLEGEEEGVEVVARKGKLFFSRDSSGRGSLRVPGPVRLRAIPFDRNGFQLTCSKGIFAQIEGLNSVSPSSVQPWRTPKILMRMEAEGNVVAKGNFISARGERLTYDAKTQWVSLESGRKGVVVFEAGPGLVWKSSPHLSISLKTFEIRGGVGSLEEGGMRQNSLEIRR